MPDESGPRKRLGRFAKGFGGGREALSREAIEREAAAEMGLIGGGGPSEDDEPPETTPRTSRPEPGRPARADRARKQWSRLRGALASESDAERRERLEREAAQEMRFDPRRQDLDDDDF